MMSDPDPHDVQSIKRVRVGDLPIASLSLTETAEFMLSNARRRRGRPIIMTSANGEVISRCQRDPDLKRRVLAFDVISADGESLVRASKFFPEARLPERVATTDLFPIVARAAEAAGTSFYFLGATEAESNLMIARVMTDYPKLRVLGASHGYLNPAVMIDQMGKINDLAPDILWLGMGVPLEHAIAVTYAPLLTKVGIVKTSGGLFNFLSGSRKRAPAWMQRQGLEWLWRLMLEPKRLAWRYAVTNPHAGYYLILNTGGSI